MPLWAKKYLMEIQTLEEQINQRQEELLNLKTMYGLKRGGVSERVQTSKMGDSLENEVIKCVELEREIKDLINKFYAKKHRIIGQIHELKDLNYMEILYKRYIEYLTVKQIANVFGISENAVKCKLKRAERKFGESTIYRTIV